MNFKDLVYRIVVDDGIAVSKVNNFEQRWKNISKGANIIGKGISNAFDNIANTGSKVFFAFEGFQRLVTPFNELAQKADAFNAANRKLEATAKLTGNSLDFLQKNADIAKNQFSLNTIQANNLTIALTKLGQKAGDVGKVGISMQRLLDIGAAQGLDAEKTLVAIDQAILGIDEGTDKLFQKNPSVIYAEYAKQIGTTAGKLDDQQKAQALLNEVIEQGAKVQGEYNDFLKSDAGLKAQSTAKTEELQAKLGDLANKALIPIQQITIPILDLFVTMNSTLQTSTIVFGGLALVAVKLIPAIAALGIALGPVAAAFAAVAAVAGVLIWKFGETKKEAESVNRIKFNALTTELGRLNDQEKLTNNEQARRAEIIQTLKKEYPTYLTNIDLENTKSRELRDIQREVNAEIQKRIAIQAAEKDVAESLEKAVNAQREYNQAVIDQAAAREIVNQSQLKQIDVDSGIQTLIDMQKRSALDFLQSIGRAGNLTESARAEQVNRELALTAEYYHFRDEQLNTDIASAQKARDEQVKQHEQFVNQISKLNDDLFATGGKNSGSGGNKSTTTTKTTEQIEIEKKLQQLRIETISDTFEKRRQTTNAEINEEIRKYSSVKMLTEEHKRIISELEEKRIREIETINREEVEQKRKSIIELKRLQADTIVNNFDKSRAELEIWFGEEQQKYIDQQEALTAIVAERDKMFVNQPEKRETLRNDEIAEQQRIDAALTALALKREQQKDKINSDEKAAQEQLARDILQIKATAANDEFEIRKNAIEDWFQEEKRKYEGQIDALEALAAEKGRRMAEAEKDANEAVWQKIKEDYRVLFDTLESGYDSFWQTIGDENMRGADRWKAILDGMKQTFFITIGDMLKEELSAIAKSLFAHQTAEATKTAVTKQGVLARLGAMLAGIAKEIAAVVKSVGVWLAQAAAKLVSFFASLGPLGLLAGLGAIPALIAGARAVVKNVGFFAEGGIVQGPTLGMLGEAGSPEAAIPLNQRGSDFIASLLPKVTVVAPAPNADFGKFAKQIASEIANVKINIQSVMDGQRFLRNEMPKYNKSEMKRNF